MVKRGATSLAMIATASLAVAACGGSASTSTRVTAVAEATPVPAASASPAIPAAATPLTAPGSSFVSEPGPAPELVDLVLPDRSSFDLASLRGGNVLVFFGYTHCPDVCPTTIGELFGVFEALPETKALFVSVDPERDTPEFLQDWTTYMPENFTAVTGSPGAIRRAADDYGVRYARVETSSAAGYTMSHTADIYLIDEQGRLLATYPYGTRSAQIVADLELLQKG
jgi:protein SCO1/2